MPKKTFYVTTPIYYPSGQLHIGHAYTTTLAWVLRNYKKMQNYDTKFLTGADEHGQKIAEKAAANNMSPQAYVDKMSQRFQKLWSALGIDYDYYSRTTSAQHEQAVQKQFHELQMKQLIYQDKYYGLYSVQDEEFLTKTQAQVGSDGKFYHPQSGHALVTVSEESFFFKMAQFGPWIKTYYHDHPEFIYPPKIARELLNNFINPGLADLSISRKTISWGIPIPASGGHVIYVWLDALNNYISALGYNSEHDEDFNRFWKHGNEIVHIVGKEITRFHCIYWPIILKALDLRQPTTIISHGWITTPTGKMSKSKGNVIDPFDLIARFGAEELKYFFAAKIKIDQDGIFDQTLLQQTVNADLANNFGNLLSRTVAMHRQNFDKPTPYQHDLLQPVDQAIQAQIVQATTTYKQHLDLYQTSAGLGQAMMLSKALNGYIDATMPWKLTDNLPRLSVVLNMLLNGIYAVATMLSIVMPNKMAQAGNQLQIKEWAWAQMLNWEKFDKITPQQGDPIFMRTKI